MFCCWYIVVNIVYVLSAVTFVFIFCLLLLIIMKRNSLIIKSSSVPFCVFILLMLMALSVSSISKPLHLPLFSQVCHIRLWITSFLFKWLNCPSPHSDIFHIFEFYEHVEILMALSCTIWLYWCQKSRLFNQRTNQAKLLLVCDYFIECKWEK